MIYRDYTFLSLPTTPSEIKNKQNNCYNKFYFAYYFIQKISKNDKKVLTNNKQMIYTYAKWRRNLKMKILGEKSLSSKVIIGLNILFAIISFIDVFVLTLIAKSIRDVIINVNLQENTFNLNLFSMIIVTGIIALFIIYQFIKIFENLKRNILFSTDNSKRLNKISISCFIISAIYLIISILIIILIKDIIADLISYILAFSIMLMIIFAVSGIGIKILNEIYKKAIEYKEENDLTI